MTFCDNYVIINKLSRETTQKLLKSDTKNLENQRSINTQTLKILRIFRDRKGQKCSQRDCSEFIRSKETDRTKAKLFVLDRIELNEFDS